MRLGSMTLSLRGTRWLVAGLFVLGLLASGVLESTAWAQEGTDEVSDEPNIVVHIISSLGWVFGPVLLLVSVFLVGLIVWLAMDLKMSAAIPPGFVEEFTDIVNKRQFKQAFDMAKNDPSMLGKTLTAGMSRLQYGLEDARESANNMLESLRSSSEQKNNYTAVIGTLGPMLGLVGTVFGMILAFIELSSGSQPDPSKLADGIAHALSVTLIGIAISVPAIFFNAFFRNRITRITMDTGHIADDLLTQMYHNSKRPGAPATGAAPTSATPTRQ